MSSNLASASSFLGWLQQHGLATDGSADYMDSDNDLLNNWQEWIAGTIPNDARCVLRWLNSAGCLGDHRRLAKREQSHLLP